MSFLFRSDLVQGPGRGFRVLRTDVTVRGSYVCMVNELIGVLGGSDCPVRYCTFMLNYVALPLQVNSCSSHFFFRTEVLSKLGQTWLMGRY